MPHRAPPGGGTVIMSIGSARTALEIATHYTTRRKAFGVVINTFQGVSFQVAEAAMLLDAAQAMGYATCSYQKQCNSIDSYDI